MPTGSELLLAAVRKATEGEYAIERELGRGGMAVVYLARDVALERRVAIKVMLPDLIDVEGLADRFVIEARTAAHLDHPGIVTVYSVKQRDGLLFIVMKYIAGRTLDHVLRDVRDIPVHAVLEIVAQVAEALQFAHGEGVVHRDVKPSNVLLDVRGRPVITDFGIAKVTNATSITVTGALIGTPAYMSPEQCRGLPATAASDQYSLGVMAYELLARELPFTGSLFELIHAHCDEPPAALEQKCPGLDPSIGTAVMRMLAKNPRDRWANLNDVARAFTRDLTRHRDSAQLRADIAGLAASEPPSGPSSRRKAVAYDLSGQETEQVTTPAPALVITPPDPVVEVGATMGLRVSESSGASLAGVRIEWRSEDPSVATVTDQGRVTGVSIGLAKITAVGGAAVGRATVTVRAAAVNTLVITPQNPDLDADDELELIATALDARGNVMPRQAVVWVSSDVAICAISQQGRAIGVAPGRASITARVGDVEGTTRIRVKPPSVAKVVVTPGELTLEAEEARQLVGTALGSMDRPLRDRELTWRSTVPGVARVAADGIVTGVTPGTAAIVATCEGREGLCSVTVRPQPVAAIRIQPTRLELELGRSLQLNGIAEDRRGRAMTERKLDWHSENESVALVDASGKVHAAGLGNTIVHAAANGASSTIQVTVVPRPVAQVLIGTHEPSIQTDHELQLDVVLLDADGSALAGRTVQWSTSDPSIASVTSSGVVRGRRAGTVRITAVCEQVRGATKLTVASPPKPVSPPPSPPWAGTEARAAAPATAPTGADAPAVAASSPPRDRGPTQQPAGPRPSTRARRAVYMVTAAAIIAAGAWWTVYGPGRTNDTANAVSADADLSGTPTGTPGAPSTQPVGPATSDPSATGGRGDVGGGVPAPPPSSASTRPGGAIAPRGSGTTAQRAGLGSGSEPAAAGSPPFTPVASPRDSSVERQAAGVGAQGGRGGDARAAEVRVADSSGVGRGDERPPTITGQPGRGAPPVNLPDPVPTAGERGGRGAASPAPAGGGAASGAAARALLCDSAAVAATALTQQLRGDPAGQLLGLYRPQDAGDRAAMDRLAQGLRDMQRLTATARSVRNENVGTGCEWVMSVDLNWANAFGQPRRRTLQLRVELEAAGGGARVRRVFGVTGL